MINNYSSPLNSIYANLFGDDLSLEFSGNLYEIFRDLKKHSETLTKLKKILPIHKNQDSLNLAYHPPRIIRKIMDFKIQNPSSKIIQCLEHSIQLALNMYENPTSISTSIDCLEMTLKKSLSNSQYEELIFDYFHQKTDSLSSIASNPNLTQLNLNYLINRGFLSKNEEILFIALGHGGIMPGMDFFLRFKNQAKQDNNSIFYAVRYSKYKYKDKTPRLETEEIKNLSSYSKNKKVVLFDEDCCSGNTLDNARYFLEKNLQTNILTFANDSTVFEYMPEHKGFARSFN